MFSEKIYFDDIIDAIKKNNEINFFAFSMTKFHAVGINASLFYLEKMGIIPNGIVLIGEHRITGQGVFKSNFDFFTDKYNINVCLGNTSFRKTRNFFLKLKQYIPYFSNNKVSKNRIVYLIGVLPFLSIAEELKKYGIICKFICLDDGSDTYENPYKVAVMYSAIYENGNFIKKQCFKIKAYIKTFLLENIKHKLINSGCLKQFYIFKYDEGRLVINDNYAPYYKKAFALTNAPNQFDYLTDSVLLNTQCFLECNMTDGIVDLDLYKKAIPIIKKYNNNVVAKTHPRELDISKYSDLGCKLIEKSNYTQEEILGSLDQNRLPKCIISISSSTLLNTTGIFNIPAISLAKIFMKNNIPDVTREITEEYIEKYDGIVLFPSSMEEFESIIRRIHGNEEI